jgi:hypothetical protein
MNKPYIGVTDFTSRSQVERAKAAIPPGVNRRLHVGAMTSYKVLHNIPTSKGWENVWLNTRGLRELFVDDPEVYNVIHYADYDHAPYKRAPTTVEDLLTAIDNSGPYVNAIQLDMVWPIPGMIMEMKHARPGVEVLLQVSSKALDLIDEHNVALDFALDSYEGIVDYVLLDSGMGRGIAFDPSHVLRNLAIASCVFRDDQLAVAGGLGPDTYENLKPILDQYPKISCDAQGRLRPSHNALDPLNMEYVEQYIKGVCSLLSK